MKKILSKKIPIAIAGVFTVIIVSLCMFSIIHNQQYSDDISNPSFAAVASDPITEAAIDNPIHSSKAETSNSSNVLPYDNNSNFKSFQNEAVKNNPARFSCTGVVDYEDYSPSLELYDVSSTNDGEDACYSLVDDKENRKTLKIGPIGSITEEGTRNFNTQGKAPWLDENQYLIKTVKIVTGENNTKLKPKSTAGWFGCDDDIKNTKVRLSDIETIEGLNNLDMSECTNAQCMFNGSDLIENVGDKNDDFFNSLTQVDNAKGICNYTSLSNEFLNKMAQAVCSSASNTSWAFAHNTENLENFKIDDNVSKVTNASYMFFQDKVLTSITAKKLISNEADCVDKMFYDCNFLETINLDVATDWSQIKNGVDMFKFCARLKGCNGTKYNKNNVGTSYAKIDGHEWSSGYFSGTPGFTYKLEENDHGIWKENNVPIKSFRAINSSLTPSELNGEIEYTDLNDNNHTVVFIPEQDYYFADCRFNESTKTFSAICGLLSPLVFDKSENTQIRYLPITGKSFSDNIFFYKEENSQIVKILKTGIGEKDKKIYQLSDLKDSLYYINTGKETESFTAVRSINEVSFDTLYPEEPKSSGPKTFNYETTWAKNNLVYNETEKTKETCLEKVEGLTTSLNPLSPPTINGVELTNIWNCYNPGTDKDPSGFGSRQGIFWSCVAFSKDAARIWISAGSSGWTVEHPNENFHMCVCVSRTFN